MKVFFNYEYSPINETFIVMWKLSGASQEIQSFLNPSLSKMADFYLQHKKDFATEYSRHAAKNAVRFILDVSIEDELEKMYIANNKLSLDEAVEKAKDICKTQCPDLGWENLYDRSYVANLMPADYEDVIYIREYAKEDDEDAIYTYSVDNSVYLKGE